jgi:hypothetical protein
MMGGMAGYNHSRKLTGRVNMSDEFVVSNEQIDEEWQRFKNLTPKLQTDPRFCSSVGVSDVKIMPVVYLNSDET